MVDYQEHTVAASLAPFVRCVWTLYAASDASAPPDKVVPDGAPELVINCADPFVELDNAGGHHRQGDLLVAGQMTRPLWIQPTGEVDLIGIRFRPTALHAACGLTTAELNDRRVDLRDLRSAWVEPLRRIAGLPRHRRLPAVERTLLSLFGAAPATPSGVDHAVRMIEESRSDLRVSELTARLGVSERQLQRAFRREVGVSPKLYARILRFQRAYRMLEDDPTRSLQVALDCGFFDQSHLIREFQQFAARSPLGSDDAEGLTRLFTVPYL